MELLIPKRNRKDLVQFTITMDRQDRDLLIRLAETEMLKLHCFVKAILLGYIKYKNENQGTQK